jgi:hypothetical protein
MLANWRKSFSIAELNRIYLYDELLPLLKLIFAWRFFVVEFSLNCEILLSPIGLKNFLDR